MLAALLRHGLNDRLASSNAPLSGASKGKNGETIWRRPNYATIHRMIENPIYGGAYAYGKTAVAPGYDAAGVSVKIRRKARSDWLALMPYAHEGYVSWEKAETIRKMVSSNVPTSRHHGAAKHGDALLAGLLRCRRCGRKLTLRYSGANHHIPRYSCSWMDNGEPRCIAFGGLRVDDAIEEALLTMVGPGAIAAAVAAEEEGNQRRDQVREALKRDLEAARMQPIGPSGNTTPPTRPTGWWPASWKRAGTRRWYAWRRSKAGSPPMMPPGRTRRRSGIARHACCGPQDCLDRPLD
jgi:hypothetical protein